MTTIALFGGTGKTGRRVLTRLLDAGHDVRALVRDPQKLRANPLPAAASEHLELIQGDVLDAAAVARTVAGSDVVFSLFGQVKGSPHTLQTDGTRNIVTAMQEHGVRRIVSLSGGSLADPQNDRPGVPDRIIKGLMKMMAGHVLADAEGHLEVLKSSGLDWTVVRGPRLTEDPREGAYRVGHVGVNASTKISREDLADFIVTLVDDREHVGAMPFVTA
ncbi:NAD(P)-dependent oxidoreductase [Agromyces marinus]|uniref:NmrA family transcriptional regulator n=1 Tax=Agromyces marinus TaxID=1389020 RepID=A0ABN6YC66_9MICO|nr:SDR family oxidoreductase [Agromyces marinus]UIP57227.1 hypothetical protein DSM26151_00820 [Agromyces marinus]BDZ54684.1 NmrA family transcriptional regulator [Agromyces marinus]